MSTRGMLENVMTIVLVVCALTTTGVLVHRELAPPQDASSPRPPKEIKEWRSYAVGKMTRGNPQARVTVTEFSDFQCPFCAGFARSLATVYQRHPNDVRVVFRNFPLTALHPYAQKAAVAAECAAEQGRFAEYHDLLFQKQDFIGTLDWTDVAKRAQVPNLEEFNRCRNGSAVLASLRADSAAAVQLHVGGTPTVLVNRWLVSGAPTEAQLDSMVQRELAAGSSE